MKLKSYLVRSRHGIYYLRLQRNGTDKRISLRTQDLNLAAIAAYKFGVTMSVMKKNNDEQIRFATPVEVLAEDRFKAQVKQHEMQQRVHERLESLKDQQAEEAYFQTLLTQNPQLTTPSQPISEAVIQNTVPALKKMCLRDAVTEYKPALAKSKQAEKSKKMAISTINDLSAKLGADFDMSLLDDEAVEDKWLAVRLTEVAATTAKRDLSFIRAFVAWSADKKRMYCPAPLALTLDAKGEHWKYLDSNDLKALFSNLSANAEKPWHFWIPILGLYTGACQSASKTFH